MIRKMLVIAAAVAMPAATLAGITAVGSSGVASAKAYPPTALSCGFSGTVTFAKPGLSVNGSITNKTVEDTATNIAGSGTGCDTKAIKVKIPSTTDKCWSTLPIYAKNVADGLTGGVLQVQVGGTGTPPSPITTPAAAGSCDVGGASAATDPTLSATDIKKSLKAQLFYDTANSLVVSGPSAITNGFPDGIPFTDNGTKISLEIASSATVIAAACGSDVGFSMSGNVDVYGSITPTDPTGTQLSDATGPMAYSLLLCLGTVTDSGADATGTFLGDFLAMVGGDQTITLSVANVDPAVSALNITD